MNLVARAIFRNFLTCYRTLSLLSKQKDTHTGLATPGRPSYIKFCFLNKLVFLCAELKTFLKKQYFTKSLSVTYLTNKCYSTGYHKVCRNINLRVIKRQPCCLFTNYFFFGKM